MGSGKLDDLLNGMIGSWEGRVQTWFKPGELADESDVKGTISEILGGRMIRHVYDGSMQGKPRTGEETLAFNHVSGEYEVAWFDDFHMSYGILFSTGDKSDDEVNVFATYAVGSGQPDWGWRTIYKLPEPDQLIITAFNVTPDGQEGKAVETIYRRV